MLTDAHLPRNFFDPYDADDAYNEAVDRAYDRLEANWREENSYPFAEEIVVKILENSKDQTLESEMLVLVEDFVKTLPTYILNRLAPAFGIDSLTTEAEREVEEYSNLTREDFM